MEDVLVVRDGYRLQRWVEIIRERQESGLTNKEILRPARDPGEEVLLLATKGARGSSRSSGASTGASGRERREPQETAN